MVAKYNAVYYEKDYHWRLYHEGSLLGVFKDVVDLNEFVELREHDESSEESPRGSVEFRPGSDRYGEDESPS